MDDHVIGPSVVKAMMVSMLAAWTITGAVLYLIVEEDHVKGIWGVMFFGPIGIVARVVGMVLSFIRRK